MRILVAEDERQLASFLKRGLHEAGYAADAVHDGAEAVLMAKTGVYDVLILDILLPIQSGYEVIRELRAAGVETKILCLTALDKTPEIVAGLDLGADDYLVKPFDFSELLARLRALYRRSADGAPAELRCSDLALDPATRKVTRAGRDIALTPREFALLEYLMRHVNVPVTRTAIIQHVWDMNFDSLTNVVDVFINRLRTKMDRPFGRRLLRTLRGVGYILQEPDA